MTTTDEGKPTPAPEGVILFAHGSRDPLWRRPMEAVAARMADRAPGTPVRCAYLELTEPDLPTTAAEMAALDLRSVRIVPMFLGAGRHVREDLPALVTELRLRHPTVRWELARPVGEDERLLDLLADLAAAPAPEPLLRSDNA